MPTFVLRNGQFVEKHLAEPRYDAEKTALYVISDEMPTTRHMATGRYFTSKKAFRDETRAAGCVEVGNDWAFKRNPMPLSREKRREDIKRTIYNLRNGIRDN